MSSPIADAIPTRAGPGNGEEMRRFDDMVETNHPVGDDTVDDNKPLVVPPTPAVIPEKDDIEKASPDEEDEEKETDHNISTFTTETTPFSSAPNTVSLRKMRNNVFFTSPDWKQRVGAYYLLIFLAAVIATSGVAGDSAATVIGAMIVAPLMTPIQGIVLSIVTRDCKNLSVSLWLVFSGAVIAVVVGFVYGFFVTDDAIVAENNSQIASRTLPKLTDLIAALATGAVGSVAMVREDISNTLPGVSIAISLVPPLNVVGLTLSTGAWEDAAGAMVLFLTNVCSILFIGSCTLLSYKINLAANNIRGCLHRTFACSVSSCVVLFMFVLLIAVAVPLVLASWFFRRTHDITVCVESELSVVLQLQDFEVSQVTAQYSSAFAGFIAEAIVAGPVYLVPPPHVLPVSNISTADSGAILYACDIEELTVSHVPVMKYVVEKNASIAEEYSGRL